MLTQVFLPYSFFVFFILLINSKKRDTKDCGISVGRLFRFIRESSSRRYFPRVHVPIPIGRVVNTVCPGIYPCYLIVSFHSKASSYTAAYTVILTLIRFFLDPCIAVGLPLAIELDGINVVGVSRISSRLSSPSIWSKYFYPNRSYTMSFVITKVTKIKMIVREESQLQSSR